MGQTVTGQNVVFRARCGVANRAEEVLKATINGECNRNACSKNPLEFAIPCHRVLRSNGAYSCGSEWGDWRQATIVRREAA